MLHLFSKIYLATDNIVDVNFDRVVVSDTHGIDVSDAYKLNHGTLIAYGKDLPDIVGEGKKYSSVVALFESLALKLILQVKELLSMQTTKPLLK
jgi:hypothetical protein